MTRGELARLTCWRCTRRARGRRPWRGGERIKVSASYLRIICEYLQGICEYLRNIDARRKPTNSLADIRSGPHGPISPRGYPLSSSPPLVHPPTPMFGALVNRESPSPSPPRPRSPPQVPTASRPSRSPTRCATLYPPLTTTTNPSPPAGRKGPRLPSRQRQVLLPYVSPPPPRRC